MPILCIVLLCEYGTAANTADMKQNDHFVIAILEMCPDLELSKRFHEVKADELTWEKLKDVAEVYERATTSDNRAMMVNSNKKNLKKNQNALVTNTKQCWRCNKKGHITKEFKTDKDKLYCKFCEAKGHISEACKKEREKNRNNGTSRPNNTHKARQVTGAKIPKGTRPTTTKLVGPSSRVATTTKSTI